MEEQIYDQICDHFLEIIKEKCLSVQIKTNGPNKSKEQEEIILNHHIGKLHNVELIRYTKPN